MQIVSNQLTKNWHGNLLSVKIARVILNVLSMNGSPMDALWMDALWMGALCMDALWIEALCRETLSKSTYQKLARQRISGIFLLLAIPKRIGITR